MRKLMAEWQLQECMFSMLACSNAGSQGGGGCSPCHCHEAKLLLLQLQACASGFLKLQHAIWNRSDDSGHEGESEGVSEQANIQMSECMSEWTFS